MEMDRRQIGDGYETIGDGKEMDWKWIGGGQDLKFLTQLSSLVSNVRKDLVRENFHARLVLFIS